MTFVDFGSDLKDTASLRSNGVVFLRNNILEKHNIKKTKYVRYYIDNDLMKLKIKFSDENIKHDNVETDKTAYFRKTILAKNGLAFNISCIMDYFEINKQRLAKFEIQIDKMSTVNEITIDLSIFDREDKLSKFYDIPICD